MLGLSLGFGLQLSWVQSSFGRHFAGPQSSRGWREQRERACSVRPGVVVSLTEARAPEYGKPAARGTKERGEERTPGLSVGHPTLGNGRLCYFGGNSLCKQQNPLCGFSAIDSGGSWQMGQLIPLGSSCHAFWWRSMGKLLKWKDPRKEQRGSPRTLL